MAAGAAAALLACQSELAAQSWIDRDGPVELRGARNVEAPNSKTASSSKDFEVGFILPLRYSSNAVNPSTDSLIGGGPDWHVAPEVFLKWSHQYDWAKVSAEVGVGIDRYANGSAANSDTLYSSFKIAKTDGRSDLFVPYAVLTSNMYFEPDFRRPDIVFHDIAAGFSSGIGWRDKELIQDRDGLIAYQDATEPGDISALFDARIGRRMSDMTDYQNTFVALKAEFTYIFSPAWRAEVTPKFRARWYEDYFGEKRTDYRTGIAVGLNWTPKWLTAVLPRGQLSINFDFYRNYSNMPDKSYSLWELGPTVELRTKF